MKPFDLEKALSGEKVVCRNANGNVLEIKYFEKIPDIFSGCVVAKIMNRRNGEVSIHCFSVDGRWLRCSESGMDLLMA